MAMTCTSCGVDLPQNAKFCAECGTPVTVRACPACGVPAERGRFCMECGTPIEGSAAAHAPIAESGGRSIPWLSEGSRRSSSATSWASRPCRSPATPRTSASCSPSYFELCRTVIGRYGGTVEKFIGDAVMAVWGVPTAHEDDAERAVRAGLEIVESIAAMGAALRAPDLAMRVGVVTGEVAVTIGATGQGMVAGDAVNTAARVQSAATTGAGLGGRDDPAAELGGDLVHGRGRACAQGQGRAGPALGGRSGRGRRGGRSACGRPRGAPHGPRPGAATHQGAVPRLSRVRTSPTRGGRR